jgi:hypothetical protein
MDQVVSSGGWETTLPPLQPPLPSIGRVRPTAARADRGRGLTGAG